MNTTTNYMGLSLKTPLVASSSPLSKDLNNIKQMEDVGAGAIIMFSLFEEQIKQEQAALDHFMEWGTDSFAESLSYFPEVTDLEQGSEAYLNLLEQASSTCDIPIIGSLNGITSEGWIRYAKDMEQAGAAGIELNIYFNPTDLTLSGTDVENRYLEILKQVTSSINIPVAMKLSPYFSSFGHMATKLDQAGADALVLFNRFYRPDIDLENKTVQSSLHLSSPYEIRLPLMWIALLHGKVDASIGATTGVHSAEEVIKYIMAGADVTMTTSALLKKGIDYLSTLQKEMEKWMNEHEYESIEQMKGSMSHAHTDNPQAFERANYITELTQYNNPYLEPN